MEVCKGRRRDFSLVYFWTDGQTFKVNFLNVPFLIEILISENGKLDDPGKLLLFFVSVEEVKVLKCMTLSIYFIAVS